ncbi:MAG: hypothetical protein Q8R25_02550 [bacterium]|nr:hypothetical protein [bacterium]
MLGQSTPQRFVTAVLSVAILAGIAFTFDVLVRGKSGQVAAASSSIVTVAADKTSYVPGEQIVASWNNPGTVTDTDWIGLVPNGGGWPANNDPHWVYTRGAHSGSAPLQAPAPSTLGTYQIVYFTNNVTTELVRSAPFQISANDPTVTVSTSGSSFDADSPITGSWTNSGGALANDWIGLVPASGDWPWPVVWPSDGTNRPSWVWASTNTQNQQGNAAAQSGSITMLFPVGQPAGQYQFVYYLIKQDSSGKYIEKTRSAPFTVTVPSGSADVKSFVWKATVTKNDIGLFWISDFPNAPGPPDALQIVFPSDMPRKFYIVRIVIEKDTPINGELSAAIDKRGISYATGIPPQHQVNSDFHLDYRLSNLKNGQVHSEHDWDLGPYPLLNRDAGDTLWYQLDSYDTGTFTVGIHYMDTANNLTYD